MNTGNLAEECQRLIDESQKAIHRTLALREYQQELFAISQILQDELTETLAENWRIRARNRHRPTPAA